MNKNAFLKGISLVIVVAMMFLSLPCGVLSVSAEEIEGEIYLDSPVSVYDSGDDMSVLYFTPEKTGIYCVTFVSEGEVYCYGEIFDANDEILVSGSDYYGRFSMLYQLTAGNTYAIRSGIGEHEFGSHGSYTVTVSRSDIASIEFEDTFVIENYDSRVDYAYNDMTEQYDIEWVRYDYYPNIILTYTDGSVETFVESYYYEPDDSWFYPECRDNQYHYMPWTVGNTYTARATLFGVTDTFEVEVTENPVERLEVSTVTFVEGEHNSSCGEYIDGDKYVEYDYYSPYPDYTVYFKDGYSESFTYYDYVSYKGREFGLNMWHDQDYYNRWGAGEHTAYASFMGYETTFTVEVIGSPIVDLTVENLSMTVGTGGYYSTDWDEEGNEIEWYCYNLSPNYTVTYADGSTETIASGEPVYFNGEYYWLSTWSDQGFNNQWGVGEHTAKASLFGVEATFMVEIIPSPIESISIAPVSIPEGSYSWERTDSSEEGSYSYLVYGDFPVECTVTFRDGSVQTVNRYEEIEYEGEYYSIDFNDDQSCDNQWGIGTHVATASLLGVKTEFTVEITKSPIVAVYVDNMSTIEYTGGFYNTEWDEYGNPTEWFEYSLRVNYTVVLEDNSTISVPYYKNGITIDDIHFGFHTRSDQSFANQWGVGTHTAYASIGGKQTAFDVIITESPIVGVVFKDIELYEGFDGYTTGKYNPETGCYDLQYFRYEYTPSCVVLLKDGTVLYSEDGGIEYGGEMYRIEYSDTQEENEWGIGTHPVSVSVLGYQGNVNVTVKQCPYTGIEISGTTDLWITLYKKDGTSEKVKAIGFGGASDEGILKTTGRTLHVSLSYSLSDDGSNEYNKDLKLIAGSLESNSLDGNLWFDALFRASIYEGVIEIYRMHHDNYVYVDGADLGDFGIFDGKITKDNIDAIATIAVWICDEEPWSDQGKEFETVDGVIYYLEDSDFVRECIERIFGITSLDLTESKLYDPSKPDKVKIMFQMAGGRGGAICNLRYENGNWIFDGYYDPPITLIMNDDLTLKSFVVKQNSDVSGEIVSVEIASMPHKVSYMMGELIDLRGISLKITYSDGTSEIVTSNFSTAGFDSKSAGEKIITVFCGDLTASFAVTVEDVMIGDISGDGTVNAVDSNLLKRIIAGTLEIENEEFVNKAADINGDGTVNAVDANLLKQVIVGII